MWSPDSPGKLSDMDKAMIAQFNIEGVRLAMFERRGTYFVFQLKKDGNTILPNGIELEKDEAQAVGGFLVWLRRFVAQTKPRGSRRKK